MSNISERALDPEIALELQQLEDMIPTHANRPRDCKVRRHHFLYGKAKPKPRIINGQPVEQDAAVDEEDSDVETKNRVQILKPCLESTCKTCQKYQSHHFPDFILNDGRPVNVAAANSVHELPSIDQRFHQPTPAPRVNLTGDVPYTDEETPRPRRRLRKRIVLKFAKPSITPAEAGNFKSARFGMFKMFIKGNKIPKRTGQPGGLIKIKFAERKEEFREMVEGWVDEGEVRLPDRGVDSRENDMEESREDDADYDQIEEDEGADEEDRQDSPDMGENVPSPRGPKRAANDEWWDETSGPSKRHRQRFDMFPM